MVKTISVGGIIFLAHGLNRGLKSMCGKSLARDCVTLKVSVLPFTFNIVPLFALPLRWYCLYFGVSRTQPVNFGHVDPTTGF